MRRIHFHASLDLAALSKRVSDFFAQTDEKWKILIRFRLAELQNPTYILNASTYTFAKKKSCIRGLYDDVTSNQKTFP